ncbi:MAG: mechanosensitive ion channel family protein [Micropruina sp.]|nr:mechanosensitive ion channel family protein [Micropruina sp.]
MKQKFKNLTSNIKSDFVAMRERSILDNLKRYREPAAWIWIIAVAGGVVLAVVRLFSTMNNQSLPLSGAAVVVGSSVMNLAAVIGLVVLVWTCLFVPPSTPRATLITWVAGMVVLLGTLITVVLMVLGLPAAATPFLAFLDIMGGLLDVLLKAACAGALLVIYRAVRRGNIDIPDPVEDPVVEVGDVATDDIDAPSWKPDVATGTAWTSAAAAAAGDPGETGTGGGWRAVTHEVPGTSGTTTPVGEVSDSKLWRPVGRHDTSNATKDDTPRG